jgi:phosphatidylglycerol---prolipoprotein diacylglyceryl transferase
VLYPAPVCQTGVLHLTFAFDPILVAVGPFQLGWHGIFTVLALVVALGLADRLAQQRGLPLDGVHAVATWGIVGGFLGARLFHVADHLDFYAQQPLLIPAVWEGGIAVYGAFIGGLAGGGIAAWRMRQPTWPLLDLAAPAMLVGQAIGRLGCLANGDAWGAPAPDCAVCVTIRYVHPNDLLPDLMRGVPTLAYPLYEMAAVLGLLGALWLLRGRLEPRAGATFLVASIGYAVIRFGLTFLRQETIVLWGLQEAQVVALVTGFVSVAVLAWRITQQTDAARVVVKA